MTRDGQRPTFRLGAGALILVPVLSFGAEIGVDYLGEEKGDDDPRQHWAFQRIERPAVPASNEKDPIDAFLAAKCAGKKLQVQGEAERSLLIRRLSLDLVGLPPTLEQLRDERPWGEIVEELLENPQHGERWARHWMDVWRYSDWYGLGKQLRNSQKHIWHWRDWIVDSLNADKGYDRMIHEMLAGDELAPGDLDAVRATGFLARNYYLFNRTTWLDNTIEHTSKAILGLTMNCAKCHDHKYDPIEMTDYYRMRAIFEPHQVRLDPVPGESDFEKDGVPRVFDNHLEAPTWLHLRGDPKNPDKEKQIEPGLPVIFEKFAPEIAVVELPYAEWAPGARSYVQEHRLQVAAEAVEMARKDVARAGAEIAKPQPNQAPPGGEPGYLISDEFEGPDEATWELSGDNWAYRDGALHKTKADREKNVLQTRQPHPRDFEVTCRYTVTSGTTYKSVGICFDRIDGGVNQHQVYTSAHEPEPKVQVMHVVDGKDQYPSHGKVKRPVVVGETYELRFAVRDRLLNVWLNGEFVLAYALPRRLAKGRLARSGFDAVVVFDSLKMRALPADIELREAADGPAGPSLEVGKAILAAAQAELASVQAIVAAGRARAAGGAEFDALARAAVERGAEARVARARADVLREKDEKKLKAAKERLAKTEKNLTEAQGGGGEYRTFRASRKALETPEHKEEQYPATWPRTSTGRRTALAKWITHRENPLPARVAVNHVWMRHFGEPLVETVFDFGRRARRPEQAELLDYLAVEFIESGWSFRHLHRLMVTSQAYRRSSSKAGADPATMEADPENKYYWRMNPRRMESEVVRDSLLQLAGVLDPKRGGPSIDPKAGGMRRSLYFQHSRDQKDKFLSMFDGADHLRCYRRSESVKPQQALALSNSKLSLAMAQKIASRVGAEQDLDQFIAESFEAILCRRPDEEERTACREFCEALRNTTKGKSPEGRVRTRLVHALLNHNDFVTIR